jgi:aryl-alcohol dehydrogenase-like predicted oxidoreductase
LKVARFALGGNVFGWTVDERTGFRLLEEFVSAGFNLIDTADTYSKWVSGHRGGESESMIGRWLHESGRRNEVLIATKVGMEMGDGSKGLAPGHIESSVEDSLRRLQTDVIDLYQAHIDDPSTPLEATLRTFDKLKSTGKVRAIGASNYSAARLEEALQTSERLGIARFESLQPKYNLMDRSEFEGDLAAVCQQHGLGVLTYSSLAAGFLTGKYRSKADIGKSPRGARAEPRLVERGFRILAALDSVAARLDAAPSTVALAWVMARPLVTAPIASATSEVQLQELLRAASLHLDREATQELDRASS